MRGGGGDAATPHPTLASPTTQRGATTTPPQTVCVLSHLVSLQHQHDFVGSEGVTNLLLPRNDGALRDRVTHLRYGNHKCVPHRPYSTRAVQCAASSSCRHETQHHKQLSAVWDESFQIAHFSVIRFGD